MAKISIIPILGIFLALILINSPYLTITAPAFSQTQPLKPNVVHKTDKEMKDYLDTTPMMNYSRLGQFVGNISDIEATLYGNNTYAAMIASNSSDKNNVYLQVSRTHLPTVFSDPVSLSDPLVNVNASHLGIAAFNNTYVYVIWQDTNHNGKNSIYLGTSSDSGQNFITYKQSGNNTDAKDPKIITDGKNVFFTWIEATTVNCKHVTSIVGSNMTFGPSPPNNTSSASSCHGGAGHGSGW